MVLTHQAPKARTAPKAMTEQHREGARSHPADEAGGAQAQGEFGGQGGRGTGGLRMVPCGNLTLVDSTCRGTD